MGVGAGVFLWARYPCRKHGTTTRWKHDEELAGTSSTVNHIPVSDERAKKRERERGRERGRERARERDGASESQRERARAREREGAMNANNIPEWETRAREKARRFFYLHLGP